MKIHNDIIQGSDEWLEMRRGKMSSSHSQEIGNNGKGLETYCKKLVMERYCNELEHYTNPDIDRGNELEPLARDIYQIEYEKVEQVGLVEYSEDFISSPDGLVGKNGLIEIKCMNNMNHFQFIIDKKIQSKWIWQMQGQMLATGRKWCDFVAYNPNFDKSLVVVRVDADQTMQDKILSGIELGKNLIKQLELKIN